MRACFTDPGEASTWGVGMSFSVPVMKKCPVLVLLPESWAGWELEVLQFSCWHPPRAVDAHLKA